MIKKMVMVLLCFCMLVSPVWAQDSGAFLKAVGVVESDEAPETIITRAEFVTNVLRLMKYDTVGSGYAQPFTDVPDSYWACDEIAFAKQTGLVTGNEDGSFSPDEPVFLFPAYSILLRAMGYGSVLKNEVAVLDYARSTGLNRNMPADTAQPLTRGQLFQLMDNALHGKYAFIKGVHGSEVTYETGKDITLLADLYGIEWVTGVVFATEAMAVQGATAPEGYISIEGTLYAYEADAAAFLGKRVKCYYQKDDDDRTVIYISEYRSETTQLAAEDITKFEQDRFYAGKMTYPVSRQAMVLYNGSLLSGADFSQKICPKTGTVTLIDNDEDSTADVVFVWEYTTLFVDSVDSRQETITGLVDGQPVTISCEEYEQVLVKDRSGEQVLLSAMMGDTVLSVYFPLVKEAPLSIRYSAQQDTGKVQTVDASQKLVYLEGERQLRVSADCEAILDTLVAGQEYSFYLDAFGEIVKAVRQSIEGSPVYLINIANEAFQFSIKVLNKKGEVQLLQCKNNLSVRDENGETRTMSATEIYQKLYDQQNGKPIRQPIVIRQDGQGTVTGMVLPGSKNSKIAFHEQDYGGELLTESEKKSLFRFDTGTLSFMNKINLTQTTIVFTVPKDGDERMLDDKAYHTEKPAYFTKGSHDISSAFHPVPYTFEENGFMTDILVWEIDFSRAPSLKDADHGMLLKKVVDYYDEEEQAYFKKLYLIDKLDEEFEFLYDPQEDNTLKDMNGREVVCGDIIRVTEDWDGYVTARTLQTFYDCTNNQFLRYSSASTHRYNSVYLCVPAKVLDKNKTLTRVEVRNSSGIFTPEYHKLNDLKILVFDRAENELTYTDKIPAIGEEFVFIVASGLPMMIIYYE